MHHLSSSRWSQNDISSIPDGLLLFVGFVFRLRVEPVNIFLDIVHAFLETAHALAEPLHQFGNLASSEKQEHHEGDEDDFGGAEVEDK